MVAVLIGALGVAMLVKGLRRSTKASPPGRRLSAGPSTAYSVVMPLHEYRCQGCGHEFEALVRGADQPACPACKGTDLEKLLSLFAVDSDSTRKSALQAGKKHIRKEQRDRLVADRESIDHH
jgi:putative FmdB family regulatory protein